MDSQTEQTVALKAQCVYCDTELLLSELKNHIETLHRDAILNTNAPTKLEATTQTEEIQEARPGSDDETFDNSTGVLREAEAKSDNIANPQDILQGKEFTELPCVCHCHNNHEGNNGTNGRANCKCLPNCAHCNQLTAKVEEGFRRAEEVLREQPKKEGAPEGNNNNERFKTPGERAKLFDTWCNHIAQGYSRESFPLLSPQRFKEYVKKYPVEFDTDKIEEAERKGRMFWETVGRNGSIGAPMQFNGKFYDKYNSQMWKFNMMNRYRSDWKERQDITSDNEKIPTPIAGGQSMNAIRTNDSDK